MVTTCVCRKCSQRAAPSACSFPWTRGRNSLTLSRTARADFTNYSRLTKWPKPLVCATLCSTPADIIIHESCIHLLWLPQYVSSGFACIAPDWVPSSDKYLGGKAQPFYWPSRIISVDTPVLSRSSPWTNDNTHSGSLYDSGTLPKAPGDSPMADGVPGIPWHL